MIEEFVERYPNNFGKKQESESTSYKRRKAENSELNINKSNVENFNILRVCDNEKYSAYFHFKNKKYGIKIFKDEKNN